MFPQSFIISFQSAMMLKSIQIFCSNGMQVLSLNLARVPYVLFSLFYTILL